MISNRDYQVSLTCRDGDTGHDKLQYWFKASKLHNLYDYYIIVFMKNSTNIIPTDKPNSDLGRRLTRSSLMQKQVRDLHFLDTSD